MFLAFQQINIGTGVNKNFWVIINVGGDEI